ncbi:MAG: hypothetical protein U5O39_14815 [Gammaproteobacteria bacterium]|nr:hypothetical protein [Gammaproteobacteria bacterium]
MRAGEQRVPGQYWPRHHSSITCDGLKFCCDFDRCSQCARPEPEQRHAVQGDARVPLAGIGQANAPDGQASSDIPPAVLTPRRVITMVGQGWRRSSASIDTGFQPSKSNTFWAPAML